VETGRGGGAKKIKKSASLLFEVSCSQRRVLIESPILCCLCSLASMDYRIVPGSFPNPVVSVGVCYTAVDAVAGGLTTGWWAVVLKCFSSHLMLYLRFLLLASSRTTRPSPGVQHISLAQSQSTLCPSVGSRIQTRPG